MNLINKLKEVFKRNDGGTDMNHEKYFNIDKYKLNKIKNSNFWIGNENQIGQKEFDFDITDEINGLEELKKVNRKLEEVRLHLKRYLELDNVSFLFGAGSSYDLNAPVISKIPIEIEKQIKSIDENKKSYNIFLQLVNYYKDKNYDKENRNLSEDKDNEIDIPLERFLNYLYGLLYVVENSKKEDKLCLKDNLEINKNNLEKLINNIKKSLFKLVDIDNNFEFNEGKIKLNEELKYFAKRTKKGNDKYYFHKKLIKSLLSRSNNLKRPNIFTLNYDLAFENAFDELGIHYIDGFSGFNKRSFKPEVFNYDYFYPGDTTQGNVNRVEKVVKYYKLHGSLTWIKGDRSKNNIYGLFEKPIELIRKNIKKNKKEEIGKMMIYPTTYKKEYTLDFPYSELFRRFSHKINQQQSVLFCIGYSFSDEHINDMIYQALSIPSFTLVIVDYQGINNKKIKELKNLDDPRILILEGDLLGDFKFFADQILPNIHEVDYNEEISDTLDKLFKKNND